jgi:thiol-disulfide isomerase/thioredoxin
MKYTALALVVFTICFSCTNKKAKPEISTFELAPEIILLDKDNPVNSLDDLTRFFSGKTVYIDRWATWCSPCLEEFKYGDPLHKFLNDNNIEMVYLNSDKDIQDSVLYQFIISHNLVGYHLRLNDTLKKDLSDKKIFIPIIPQFMIMDKEGNIVENRALRPSNGDSLFAQLMKYHN